MPDTDVKTRTYQLSLARIAIQGMFEITQKTLGDSWIPGATANRYGREWRLSRPEVEDEQWIGRIGFVRPDEVTTLEWDDEAEDFVEGDASGGVVVPFVVDLQDEVVAYQLRSNLVRPNTFTGALEALLNKGPAYKWHVHPLIVSRSFNAWKSDIERVTSFRLSLIPPNPNWVGRELVQGIVEDLEAQLLTLSGSGEDIDTESDLFRQALDHVLQEYGQATVHGVDASGLDSTWRTMKDIGGVVTPTMRVEAESDEVEVPIDSLTESLSAMQHRMDIYADDDASTDNDDESEDPQGPN